MAAPASLREALRAGVWEVLEYGSIGVLRLRRIAPVWRGLTVLIRKKLQELQHSSRGIGPRLVKRLTILGNI
jgi:hypothetical protein